MTTATASEQQTNRPSASLSDETLKGWLRDMTLIREFETRSMQAYSNAKIGGFLHIYIGQEACAVGTFAAVNHDDPVICAYRDHGLALARGMDPKHCMAEMYGKLAGCAKGKGGSMHMFDKPNHLYGGHGIVGAQTPLGLGLAFAVKYEREVMGAEHAKVALCFLGDGALNQGSFHESMNLAGLLDVPVIFIVENNQYAMGTHIERGTTMARDLGKKAAAYEINYTHIDGMDVLEVYDRFKPIADGVREARRPHFVELETERYQGHSMSDPQKYRAREDIKQIQEQRDPIETLAKHLMEQRNCLTEDERDSMEKDVRKQVREAMKFADEAEAPDVERELYSDVYINPFPPYVKGAPNVLEDGGQD